MKYTCSMKAVQQNGGFTLFSTWFHSILIYSLWFFDLIPLYTYLFSLIFALLNNSSERGILIKNMSDFKLYVYFSFQCKQWNKNEKFNSFTFLDKQTCDRDFELILFPWRIINQTQFTFSVLQTDMFTKLALVASFVSFGNWQI